VVSTYWVKMLNDSTVLGKPDDNFWTTAYLIPDTAVRRQPAVAEGRQDGRPVCSTPSTAAVCGGDRGRHTGNDHLDVLLARQMSAERACRESGRPCGPEVVVRLAEHRDVVEHFSPVGRIPPGHDQSQRKAVQKRQRRSIHRVGDHDLAVASMIDGERIS